MKKGFMGIVLATTCLILTGCFADMKVVEEDAAGKLQDSKLSPYIEEASYKAGGQKEDLTPVNINLIVDEGFSNLETMEKYEVIQDAITKLDGLSIECGNDNRCVYDTLHVTYNDDKYKMSVYDKELVINDNEKYTRSDYNFDMNKVNKKEDTVNATTNYNSAPSPPNGQYASNGISYTVIFDFMKQQYNRVTNNDENYIPEVHDPQVAEIAAKRFGITAEEAGYIYEKVQMDAFK